MFVAQEDRKLRPRRNLDSDSRRESLASLVDAHRAPAPDTQANGSLRYHIVEHLKLFTFRPVSQVTHQKTGRTVYVLVRVDQ